MAKKAQAITTALGTDQLVELVGGPCCGEVIEWPSTQKFAKIEYYAGEALYEYESQGKALYVEG